MAKRKGSPADDTLIGTPSSDLIAGRDGDDLIYGRKGDDVLYGGRGNDLLHGGAGADRMVGGRGCDIYVVDDAGDVVFERPSQGTDLVRTTLQAYTLTGNVENLSYVGSADFFGTGNGGNNRIVGACGDDTLAGAAGNDTLVGGPGDDRLSGGLANDHLLAGAGSDSLEGGAGRDTAVFSGMRDDYSISVLDDRIEIVDLNPADGDDGTDLLNGIETLKFADVEIPAPEPMAVIDLAALDGQSGVTLLGPDGRIFTGNSVSLAGDVNGDGFADMLVGGALIPGAGMNPNESYLVFGKASWEGAPTLDLGTLDGGNGIALVNGYGRIVASAGDINGDGIGDVVIGAPGAPFSSDNDMIVGGGYVVFGKTDWSAAPALDLQSLDGTNGFFLRGANLYDYAGAGISLADINGDGFSDLLLGAPGSAYGANAEGHAYVVFGKGDWSGIPVFDLADLDGSNGFRVSGAEFYDYAGRSVSSAGDVNGDGFTDFIVGAPEAVEADIDPPPPSVGQAYVVFGKADWAGAPDLALATLDGADGFRLGGIAPGDFAGSAVSAAGDINGDGYGDLIVAASSAEGVGGGNGEGETYIVFGKADWSATPSLSLDALGGGTGFVLRGIDAEDRSGYSASSAGDFNGDGLDDFIVGAPGAEHGGEGSGESYLIYGKAHWSSTAEFDLANLDAATGLRLIGVDDGDASGIAVSGGGDINGDGYDDLLIGAAGAERPGVQGEVYVILGGDFAGTAQHVGTADHDLFDTTFGVASFHGGADNDTFRAPADIRSIERIDLEGSGANSLTLDVRDVLNLPEESNNPAVSGDAGDAVDPGDGWSKAASGGTNGDGTTSIAGADDTYQIYTPGAATLLIDTDLTTAIA